MPTFLNPLTVTVWKDDADEHGRTGTAILADTWGEAGELHTVILVIDDRSREGKWYPLDQVEWHEVSD